MWISRIQKKENEAFLDILLIVSYMWILFQIK